jgi:hypothetical protein
VLLIVVLFAMLLLLIVLLLLLFFRLIIAIIMPTINANTTTEPIIMTIKTHVANPSFEFYKINSNSFFYKKKYNFDIIVTLETGALVKIDCDLETTESDNVVVVVAVLFDVVVDDVVDVVDVVGVVGVIGGNAVVVVVDVVVRGGGVGGGVVVILGVGEGDAIVFGDGGGYNK